MAYPENALTLDILPLSADTARLVRVYGTEPCIALPGTLPAPEGGSFAVTELGDYCFSEKPRSLPAADKTCRYETAPDGTARLIRAFGQTVGGTCRRYDFDFDAPASDADTLHPVCGNFSGRGHPAGQFAGDRQLCLLQLPQPAPAHGGQRQPDHGQRCVFELLCAGDHPGAGRP